MEKALKKAFIAILILSFLAPIGKSVYAIILTTNGEKITAIHSEKIRMSKSDRIITKVAYFK